MTRTKTELRDALIAQLRPKYDLVYVDQGDKFTDEQVGFLAAGQWDKLWESTQEWESENRYLGVKAVIESDLADIIRAWENEDDADYTELADDFDGSPEWDEVKDAIQDRDSGDWTRDLANGCGPVMLRATVITEDDSFSYRVIEPDELLDKIGIEATEANLREAREIISESSPEFSFLMGYWLASVSVRALLDLPYDTEKVTLTNPGFWLGTAMNGNGWAGQFTGTVTVDRSELGLDRQRGRGYGWQETAGCDPGVFPVEIAAVPKVEVAS